MTSLKPSRPAEHGVDEVGRDPAAGPARATGRHSPRAAARTQDGDRPRAARRARRAGRSRAHERGQGRQQPARRIEALHLAPRGVPAGPAGVGRAHRAQARGDVASSARGVRSPTRSASAWNSTHFETRPRWSTLTKARPAWQPADAGAERLVEAAPGSRALLRRFGGGASGRGARGGQAALPRPPQRERRARRSREAPEGGGQRPAGPRRPSRSPADQTRTLTFTRCDARVRVAGEGGHAPPGRARARRGRPAASSCRSASRVVEAHGRRLQARLPRPRAPSRGDQPPVGGEQRDSGARPRCGTISAGPARRKGSPPVRLTTSAPPARAAPPTTRAQPARSSSSSAPSARCSQNMQTSAQRRVTCHEHQMGRPLDEGRRPGRRAAAHFTSTTSLGSFSSKAVAGSGRVQHHVLEADRRVVARWAR